MLRMTQEQETIDNGTAYGMAPREYKSHLVEVGPGTPMGELMRRYWQPCFTSAALSSDKPERVKLLGEHLILFRDKQGRPGLVHEHCCHRGSSLYYGRIEEDGIRCCYHGWKFDAQGHCLDQPAEVDGGRNRNKIRQPWYPVQERYGLIYAYMGPPEKKPVLPRWQHLEDISADEIIEVRAKPGYGLLRDDGYTMKSLNFNWLATYENTMDAPHLPWLHYHHSGDQFTALKLSDDRLPPYAQIKDLVGSIVAERSALGVKQGVVRQGPGDTKIIARNEAIIPNIGVISLFIDLYYIVPTDDTHFLTFMLWRAKRGQPNKLDELHNGKTWWEMTEEEHRLSPGDYEAQSSIGELPAHNHEHLSAGDVAIGMLRRRLEEAVRDVAEGRNPPGLVLDPNAPPLQTEGHPFRPYEAAA